MIMTEPFQKYQGPSVGFVCNFRPASALRRGSA
jgi:hypothetical protein